MNIFYCFLIALIITLCVVLPAVGTGGLESRKAMILITILSFVGVFLLAYFGNVVPQLLLFL